MDGGGIGLDLRSMLVPPGRFRRPQTLEPRGTVVGRGLDRVREDLEHRGAVAGDRGIRDTVAPQFSRVTMDVNQPLRAEASVLEAEVERRSDHAGDIRLVERCRARVLEEERMLRRQGPSSGAAQEDRQAAVLGEPARLLRGPVPPDPASGDDGGPLRGVQQVGGLHGFARVAERPRRRRRRQRRRMRLSSKRMSAGSSRYTGPRGGASACRNAIATYSGIRLEERARRPLRGRLHERELVELLQRSLLGLGECGHRRARGAEPGRRQFATPSPCL